VIWTVENGRARKSDEVEYAPNFKAAAELMKDCMSLILCTISESRYIILVVSVMKLQTSRAAATHY
jgi:hypothetical protein